MKSVIFQKATQREDGQTLVMFVFFLVVLILFVGLGIDLGFAYVTKANLAKAVDAGALVAMKNISQGTLTAQNIGSATFAANYGRPGRDVAIVNPTFTWATDAANNRTLDVDATASINTFFIRVLPTWKTLSVKASAQTTRAKLVMSLVLDRSGSMRQNGGAAALPPAVSNFISLFDDQEDRAAMVSFSWGASTDVTMRQPFKTAIKNAANALNFDGYTGSERGLTNGLVENNTVSALPGEKVVKIIVFFSDGMANTWYYTFNCGPRNIAQATQNLFDPVTGAPADSGCTVPGTLPAINGGTVDTTQCVAMNLEAQARAERIAFLARGAGNIVYAIGMGDPTADGECGGAFRALNPDFLKNLANTADSNTYNQNQPVGDYAIAANAAQLNQVFQTIAAKILLRITR